MSQDTATPLNVANAITSLRSFLRSHPRLKYPCLITHDQSGKCASLFQSLTETTTSVRPRRPRFDFDQGEEEWTDDSASYINGRPKSEPLSAACWHIVSSEDADLIVNSDDTDIQLVSYKLTLDLSGDMIIHQGNETEPPPEDIYLKFPNLTWKSLLGRDLVNTHSLLKMTWCTQQLVRRHQRSLPSTDVGADTMGADLADEPPMLVLGSDLFQIEPNLAKWKSSDRQSYQSDRLSSISLRWNIKLDRRSGNVWSLGSTEAVTGGVGERQVPGSSLA